MMSDSPVATVATAIAEAWQQNKKSLSQTSNPRFAEHNSPFLQRNGLDYKQLKLSQNSSAGLYVTAKYEKDHGSPASINDLGTILTLDYTVEIVGDPFDNSGGRPLYIALHGGGGPTPDEPDAAKSNDSQWQGMANAYKGAIQSGVWISARGVGDSWDMHFTGASYVLIERLIENMIMFGAPDKRTTSPVAIDPNRVYLIGFSAGGDGVYRLAPRLAQRFAAVNMGGGHPGSVLASAPRETILRNLANTPICLQVGEKDNLYDRSQLVAQSAMDLDEVKTYYTKVFQGVMSPIYTHDVFIHPTDPEPAEGQVWKWRHNHWEQDNFNWSDPNQPRPQHLVVSDYAAWRKGWANNMPSLARGTSPRYTNAIDWLNKSTRNPLPQAIVWDLSRGATDKANDQFDVKVFDSLSGNGAQNYWLDVSGKSADDIGTLIEARIEKETSTIYVTSAKNYLRVLLRPEMVSDMSKVKVQITVGGQSKTLGPYRIGWNQAIINQTLARNDPNLIFSSDVVLTLVQNVWQVTTSSPAPLRAAL